MGFLPRSWCPAAPRRLKPYQFRALLDEARRQAESERPAAALEYFDRALAAAQMPDQRTLALSGRGNMLIWLGDYEGALETYTQMLATAQDEAARSAALAGRVRALVILDRPREAVASVPTGAMWTPELALASATAALRAGWPDGAAAALAGHADSLAALPNGSRAANDAEALRRALRAERADSAGARFEIAAESDDFRAQKLTLAATHFLSNGAQLSVQRLRVQYAQDDWSRRGEGAAAGFALNISDALALSTRLGRIDFGGWSPTVGAGSVVYAPDDFWRVEGFVERDTVETRDAFDARIASTVSGVAVDYLVHPRLTLVGMASRQEFTDGNRRDGVRARAALVVSRSLGFGLELRAREFESTRPDLPGYFNPEKFRETELIGTWGTRLASGWRLRAAAGPGTQMAEPGGVKRSIGFAELRAERLLDACLKLELAAVRSTSAGASDSGFQRTYGSAWLSCAW